MAIVVVYVHSVELGSAACSVRRSGVRSRAKRTSSYWRQFSFVVPDMGAVGARLKVPFLSHLTNEPTKGYLDAKKECHSFHVVTWLRECVSIGVSGATLSSLTLDIADNAYAFTLSLTATPHILLNTHALNNS